MHNFMIGQELQKVNTSLSITYNVTECGMVLPNDNVTGGEPWLLQKQ